MKVCIDPGHGGADTGAIGNGFYEKDLSLKISLKLKEYLLENGIEAVLTRENDILLNENPRVDAVKNSVADICLSIHLNASNGRGNGIETIYQMNNSSSQRLAEIILEKVSSLGLKKRRAYFKESKTYPGQDYYFMLRKTKPLVSVIVECLFIDNVSDIEFIKEQSDIEKLAQAIGDGVINFFGIENWAKTYFDNLLKLGIIEKMHNTYDTPTWGELASVVSKTIEHLKKN